MKKEGFGFWADTKITWATTTLHITFPKQLVQVAPGGVKYTYNFSGARADI